MMAATKAIIAPLPVSSSAEKYSPKKTELSPKNCVQAKHERKLRPTNCAVAAGVTSKAVTKGSYHLNHTNYNCLVIQLKRRPIARTGIPWTKDAKGSTVVANKAGRIIVIISMMISKLTLSNPDHRMR